MGEINFTDEQKLAITERNKNLLVSAAAGSGKTAVLVERILNIITDKDLNVGIDNFLIVTFTRAAADEMREKINNAISSRLEKEPHNSKLIQQQLLINKARITTIDGFCSSVVKQNFINTSVDPNFRIMDEEEISFIADEVIEELFEEKYTGNDSRFTHLVEYFCNSGDINNSSKIDDHKLAEHIKEMHRFSMANPHPEKWLDNAVNMYDIRGCENIFDTPWGDFLKAEISEDIKRLELYVREFENILQMPGYYMENAQSKLLPRYMDISRELKICCENDFEGFSEVLSFEEKFPVLREKSGDDISQSGKEYLSDINKKIKDTIKAIKTKSQINNEYINDIDNLYEIVRDLVDLTKEFSQRFKDEKINRQCFEHMDIEHFALDILTDETGEPSEVAKAIGKDLYEVIVDEYQDNSHIQEEILNAVADKNRHNRFMVGDIKQSIYKFRLAKPEIFIEKYETYDNLPDSMLIPLNKNFRSRECVIDFVNYIFTQIMSKEMGDIEYNEKAELKYGANFPDTTEKVSEKVELYLTELMEKGSSAIIDSESKLEAEIIANRIQEIVEDIKEPKIYDSSAKTYRDPKYGDIVILLRSDSKHTSDYLETFAAKGIPATSAKGTDIFDTIEVKTLISMLKITDNPFRDIDLITVLHCPAYNFTAEEILKIKLNTKDGAYFDRIVEYNSENNDEIAQRLGIFLADLENFRSGIGIMTVEQIIDLIISTTNYDSYILTLTNGEKRCANLKLLKEIARENQTLGKNSLFDYLEKIKDIGRGKYKEVLSASEDNVRIMSIHASKGLEFPIVFLSQLHESFRSVSGDILIHSEMGVAPKFVDTENRIINKTFPYEIMCRYKQKEELSESMRILYVAMTRAKEKLILLGKKDDIKKYETFSCFSDTNIGTLCKDTSSKSYLRFIMYALMRNRNVLSEQCTSMPRGNDIINNKKLPCDVNTVSLVDVIQHNIKRSADNIELLSYLKDIDISLDHSGKKQEIFRSLSWVYPYKDVQDLPSKISISDLKKASYKDESEYEAYKKEYTYPEFYRRGKSISSTGRGTAYHTLMENMDFDFTKEEQVQQLKEELISRGRLTDKEAEAIDNNKIVAFLSSPISKRLRKAKKIYREQSFVMAMTPFEVYKRDDFTDPDAHILINGIIDLFFEDENGDIVLLDYKTDRIHNNDVNSVMERYRIQLELYKKAIERTTGKSVKETYLYLFDADREVMYQK